MNILFDHQIFVSQKFGGISRYFYELYRHLETYSDTTVNIPLSISYNHYIDNKTSIPHSTFLNNFNFIGKKFLIHKLTESIILKCLKKGRYSIFHPTYYKPYFINALGKTPLVITVHDMIHELFPSLVPENKINTNYKKEVVKNAAHVIAVSKSTKNDLIKTIDVPEEKITVIYHGNSMEYNPDETVPNSLPPNYVLFVGSRLYYKNFDKFIKVFAKLRKNDSSLILVCAGGGAFTFEEKTILKRLKIYEAVYRYDITDSMLPHYYANAKLFVFPSLYEGFGIPILEAFSCNCPVVCSGTSSFPEVAGNAAEYFDPTNEDSMYTAIENVLNNIDRQMELTHNGQERVKAFSWGKTAKETFSVYKKVAV